MLNFLSWCWPTMPHPGGDSFQFRFFLTFTGKLKLLNCYNFKLILPCTDSSTGLRATPSGLDAMQEYVPLSDGVTPNMRRLPDGRIRYLGSFTSMGSSCRNQLTVGFGLPVTLHGNSVQLPDNTFTGDLGSNILGGAVDGLNAIGAR